MKLEVGKSYRTVDGRNTGPLYSVSVPAGKFSSPVISMMTANGIRCSVESLPACGQVWNSDGSVSGMRQGEEVDHIVAEWIETPTSPVQEFTTKAIVAGNYGIVRVNGSSAIERDCNICIATTNASPEQLRAAALTLTEIADFLESQS